MDLNGLMEAWQSNICPGPLEEFAKSLGVTSQSLTGIGIGFAPSIKIGEYVDEAGRWVFPERDAGGNLIGVLVRGDGKEKRAIGKRGLSYPWTGDAYIPTSAWVRCVKHGLTCPICGKPDGCRVSGDNPLDPSAVLCCRISQGATRKFSQEWLHVLKNKPKETAHGPLKKGDKGDPILIVEGASDVAAAISLGFSAIGKPSASGGIDYLKILSAKQHIVVVGENDGGAGAEGLQLTLSALAGVTKKLSGIMPPSGIKDLREWLKTGSLTKEKFLQYVNDSPILAPTSGDKRKAVGSKNILDVMTEAGWTVFKSQDSLYVSVPRANAREVYDLHSGELEGLLQGLSLDKFDSVLSKDGIREVLVRLRAMDLPHWPIYIRVGHQPGICWLDLQNPARQIVRIDQKGWTVVPGKDCPIHFIRPGGGFALPVPVPGQMEGMREFLGLLHLQDEPHEAFVAAWLLGIFLPAGPTPILAMCASTGSGKSWTSKAIRAAVDPIMDIAADSNDDALLSTRPKTEWELFREASHSRVLAYDNLSYINPELSDAFCALVTGATFRTRRFYTVSETVTLGRRVSILLNGIPTEMFDRGDLRSRVRVIRPKPFAEDAAGNKLGMVAESVLWDHFKRIWPKLLGDLCSAVSAGLDIGKTCDILKSDRMRDFVRFAGIGLPIMGIDPMLLEERSAHEAVEISDEAVGTSILVGSLSALLGGSPIEWSGTATDLLQQLKFNGLGHGLGNPKAVSAMFKREDRELRAAGWIVENTAGTGQGGKFIIRRGVNKNESG